MTKYSFERAIIKLERAFSPMAKDSNEREGKVEIYYERLKSIDEYLLNKAITWLQDNYEFRNFPLIADILKAIHGVKDSMIIQNEPGGECDICQGTGWVIIDDKDEIGKTMKYNTASPCRFCNEGRAVKMACGIKDKQIKRKRHIVKIKETAKVLTENLPDIKHIQLPEEKNGYLSE